MWPVLEHLPRRLAVLVQLKACELGDARSAMAVKDSVQTKVAVHVTREGDVKVLHARPAALLRGPPVDGMAHAGRGRRRATRDVLHGEHVVHVIKLHGRPRAEQRLRCRVWRRCLWFGARVLAAVRGDVPTRLGLWRGRHQLGSSLWGRRRRWRRNWRVHAVCMTQRARGGHWRGREHRPRVGVGRFAKRCAVRLGDGRRRLD
mmetsp:Transcript_12041/g.34054  ORF Transcript_12041/g.34054 Transcript_12041/m.34054 type:complete len:203 (+) Transcript_12041:916-1524(+)